MTIRLLLIGLLTVSAAAQGVQPVNPPGLLSTETARPLLEQDPGVAAARAGLEVALQEAGILDRSPYEWTARTTAQQRSVENGPHYNEWNFAVERTLRLPGKTAADHALGSAAVEASQAHYGEVLHETAIELMTLWVEWLATERARELAGSTLQSIQSNLAAVEKRVQAGDASKLDLSIARAELAEQTGLDSDAKTQAAAAWARLASRFPGVARQPLPLPEPLPIKEDASAWLERILAQSDELKLVQAQLRIDQAHAARAQRDKSPDPTLGAYTASEVGGRERISGVMLSMPIPGGLRDARSVRASAAVEVSQQQVEFKRRQLESEIASAVVTARGAYDRLQSAHESAAAMQQNAALMQRAYALGEAELQALLLARRQATAALNSALQAQAAALKSHYRLLIDAHLIWDLAHDE